MSSSVHSDMVMLQFFFSSCVTDYADDLNPFQSRLAVIFLTQHQMKILFGFASIFSITSTHRILSLCRLDKYLSKIINTKLKKSEIPFSEQDWYI